MYRTLQFYLCHSYCSSSDCYCHDAYGHDQYAECSSFFLLLLLTFLLQALMLQLCFSLHRCIVGVHLTHSRPYTKDRVWVLRKGFQKRGYPYQGVLTLRILLSRVVVSLFSEIPTSEVAAAVSACHGQPGQLWVFAVPSRSLNVIPMLLSMTSACST